MPNITLKEFRAFTDKPKGLTTKEFNAFTKNAYEEKYGKKKMAYGGMSTKKTKMMGGGMGTKKKMGSTDYRSGGMVLSSSKNGVPV
jgi:hypothetical protein